jgi:recombination protein RecR
MHDVVAALVRLLSRQPGVGKRSAERAALHLMRNKETHLLPLIETLRIVAERVVPCAECNNLDVANPCHICASDRRRQPKQICVVEDVSDLWAMERSGMYKGMYHVLGGTLSAAEGRGPEALGIPVLERRVRAGVAEEVILATSTTLEGQATAHYLADALERTGVSVTRLAQGVPIGGELCYLDEGTLVAALQARRRMAC